MQSQEHPIAQPIKTIVVFDNDTTNEIYTVGYSDVTRIDACTKSGMHSEIPYVRVWKGDQCFAEFCQHNIIGVYFADA